MNKLLGALAVMLAAACGPVTGTMTSIRGSTLTVFAAASLTEAFTEIGEAFEAQHPGVNVVFNFAGSHALHTQIVEGAQADVFASANDIEMDALVSSGFVAQGAVKYFLTNRLTVILPADNPAGLESLEDLAQPGLKLVLAAEEVPAGNYARQSLGMMNNEFGPDFKDRVLANVVSNEDNVRQVVAKVQLGEADAGIVYRSDAAAVTGLKQIEIPAQLNVIAAYPIAPLLGAPNRGAAADFINFVLSEDGQALLRTWGFLPLQ